MSDTYFEAVQRTLDKVVGHKCSSNLLEAYALAQVLQSVVSDELRVDMGKLVQYLETALDDMQSQQFLHDLYIQNEAILKSTKTLVDRLMMIGIGEHFVKDLLEVSKYVSELKRENWALKTDHELPQCENEK